MKQAGTGEAAKAASRRHAPGNDERGARGWVASRFLAFFAVRSIAFSLLGNVAAAALIEPAFVHTTAGRGAFPLADHGAVAPLLIAENDWPGVARAARDLQADLERVTGVRPALVSAVPGVAAPTPTAVLIGTVGRSALIDDLVARGRLDVRALRGRWEAFQIEVVEAPLPGVARALVIAGSDKRGTIYGLYELSEQIGVSPWQWWADVVPERRATLFVAPGRHASGEPAVKYRGIFLNDEFPSLTNWVRAKFGDAPERAAPPVPRGTANYGREFYARIFEVLLRLRGNYLWPAMWNNAFNEDDPENARLADEFGIVMGTSHQEPMLRAQKEWDRRFQRTLGAWNYAQHPDLLENFWREGVRRNRAYESVITLGLRGANDTEMAPGGPEANRALLEKIVAQQRQILREELGGDLARVPQVWCLYKEVQDYYEHGMRVPDDVTLLWAEDNWGNVRRLPTPEERRRAGGAGVYYHFDYHGGPRSYQWLNTSPLPKIWEQMSLAWRYGADRLWIVNVGHFKGYEVPMEFFLELAWKPERWRHDNLGEFLVRWATREFGAAHAREIADLVARTAKFNGRSKPELLAPDTFSLVHYGEWETVMGEFDALVTTAEKISAALPAAKRDAFYELVLFPARASALVHRVYFAAAHNRLYTRQGRASAGEWAAAAEAAFQDYLRLVAHFHRELAGGKWDHFMDQPVLGYTSWRDPPANTLDHVKLVTTAPRVEEGFGVAVEGSEDAVQASLPAAADAAAGAPAPGPEAGRVPALLPMAGAEPALRFDSLAQQRQWIEVFNRGTAPVEFTVTPSTPWIRLSATRGTLGADRRIAVSIDWARAPRGTTPGHLTIAGGGREVRVELSVFHPATPTRTTVHGFVESEGVVAIEAEHFSASIAAGPRQWLRIADYGRTLSGMRAEAPADAAPAEPGRDAPRLEYRIHLFRAGAVNVTAITAPTLNFVPGRPLRYAVSLDEEAPQVVTLVPADFKAQNGNRDWEKTVADNARHSTSHHALAAPGAHTLKIWMIDPAVVLQKLVVNLGGLKPSYLGPPESFRGPRG
jgi:hypothetical protein